MQHHRRERRPRRSTKETPSSLRKATPSSLHKRDAHIIPTEIGKKVVECWINISALNENVDIDKFVMMPNHIHGIIIIKNTEPIELNEKKYDFEITERRGRRSLQGLIKDFKSVTTRYYKKMYNTNSSLWQASFYDEVVKSQEHYNNICQYIDENQLKWQEDCLYER